MLTDEENGEKYHLMIEELATETELPVTLVVKLIALHLEVDEASIWHDLLKFKSTFIVGSSVVQGYIDGVPQKRTSIKFRADTIFTKMRRRIYGNEKPPIEDMPMFLDMLKDHLHEGFIKRNHVLCK